MIEYQINLWTDEKVNGKFVDARCITTNGSAKNNGEAVMGRGTASQAVRRYFDKNLKSRLGEQLHYGNKPYVLIEQIPEGGALVSFPVKHCWWEPADFILIRRSSELLSMMATAEGWQTVLLPRPGCGNGKLRWEDVKPILEAELDNRFIITDLEGAP